MANNNTSTSPHALAITPGTPYDKARAIYVGVGGSIVATIDGDNITFAGAVTGSILPIESTNVVVSGTTATTLVALY